MSGPVINACLILTTALRDYYYYYHTHLLGKKTEDIERFLGSKCIPSTHNQVTLSRTVNHYHL